MLNKSVNGRDWISDALQKLRAYLNRAPIVVSDITGTENGNEGVFIVINEQKQKNFFKYDFEKDPKVWVHDIKSWLVNFYPRLIETISAPHILTADEKAIIAEQTGTIENIPDVEDRVVQINSYRIDKILTHRDIFLLLKEGEIVNGEFIQTDKPIMRRYKYTASSVLFLKKYRAGKYGDLAEISKEFFETAIPLDDVAVKND